MTNQSAANASGADGSALRLLYKLYVALAQEFSIACSPCSELDNADAVSPESRATSQAWFAELDERIAVHQLRQFLQTSPLADEAALRAALAYNLHKPEHSDSDRDKTDFLLVQLFSTCAPSLLEDNEVTFDFVARTLEPLLGSAELTPLESLQGLDEVIQMASACHQLQELFASGVIEKGRHLKLGAAANYFEPAALVAFTRFNFLLRRCFFRTMHRDLNAILDGLRTLELRRVDLLDCRGAELSGEEPVGRLRMICQSWKAMFQAEYSFGQPLRMLVDLRVAVDAALASSPEPAGEEVSSGPHQPARAMAAAAAGESSGEIQPSGTPADENESGSGENFDS
jgi:hypothetical protein